MSYALFCAVDNSYVELAIHSFLWALSSTSLLSAAQDNFDPGHISYKEVLQGGPAGPSTISKEVGTHRGGTIGRKERAVLSLAGS